MSTPPWAQYEMTHRTGSGALPASSIPPYLARDDESGGAFESGGSWFLWTVSSQMARWMCRNPRAGLPLAFATAFPFGLAAALLWNPADVVLWLIAWWWAWLAVKFTAVGTWLLVRRLAHVARPTLT